MTNHDLVHLSQMFYFTPLNSMHFVFCFYMILRMFAFVLYRYKGGKMHICYLNRSKMLNIKVRKKYIVDNLNHLTKTY
jgi:hypothetical protein